MVDKKRKFLYSSARLRWPCYWNKLQLMQDIANVLLN